MRSRGKKIGKGILVGIGLFFLTSFVLLTMVIWYLCGGGSKLKSNDIEDYGEIFELNLRSGLVVFPDKLPDKLIESEFYYVHRTNLFDPTYQIYLRCTYEPEDWQREYERLEGVRKIYDTEQERLQRDKKGTFVYPAYIAQENFDCTYEYALLTGENEITYVSTAFVYRKDIHFDEKYLPSDFMTEEGREFGSGYSIYMEGNPSSGMYSTEYDREMYVPATND